MYNKQILDAISKKLCSKKQTISVAESVTSGHLQAAFSLAENAMDFFQGGMTVYNAGQKTKHLNIDPIEAIRENSVSLMISDQMALAICDTFTCDWGLGITGYASKVPEMGVEELFAACAIAYNKQIIFSKRLKAPDDTILNVQLFYVEAILQILASITEDM